MSHFESVTWCDTVLSRAKQEPDVQWMSQPLGDGRTSDYSWGRAVDEALRMASYLQSLGYPAGSSIAILSQNCAQLVMMDLAIWMAGHVTVPLYSTMLPETVRKVLQHCNARLVFVGKLPEGAPQLSGIPDGVAGVAGDLLAGSSYPRWSELVSAHSPLEIPERRAPKELAAILYTSGTTADPKGVEVTFAAMSTMVELFLTLYPLTPDDRLFSYLPLAHVAERVYLEGASFASGARIAFSESPLSFNDDLVRTKPTFFVAVPRIWAKLRERLQRVTAGVSSGAGARGDASACAALGTGLRGIGLGELRFAGVGAAPCPPELIAWFRDLGVELFEGYGMTELFGCTHVTHPGAWVSGSVGTPLAGVECRVTAAGEIEIKSPTIMRGYHLDPAATAAAMTPDGFIRTGDQGRIAPSGDVQITGRVKELFKTSKGKYVAPAPIESQLSMTGYFDQVCVMGSGEPQPFAVGTLAENYVALANTDVGRMELDVLLEQARVVLNATLPPHEQLARLAVTRTPWTTEAGQLTPTQKLRRANLEAAYAGVASAAAGTVVWLSEEADLRF